MDLSPNPVALITGAAGGLGGAIARALAAKGFDLLLNDLAGSDGLTGLCDDLTGMGVQATPLVADITDDSRRAGFVEAAFDTYGRLDCLVNNAGVSVLARGDILDVSPESFDRCISVNLRAQFFLTQAVAKRMLAEPERGKRRSIIAITTVAVDHHVGKVLAEYCIAKAGLAHSVQHWAVRLAPHGIDCYDIRPGMMKTDMTATTRVKYDALIASGFVPAERWGDITEVGQAAAAMADGALSYAVGQTLHIDGGMRFKVF
jgi:NAD(P)-dependent dehydrogenase (short-subunit alcohol dehydrogenase family)